MRVSGWGSDVCSSYLCGALVVEGDEERIHPRTVPRVGQPGGDAGCLGAGGLGADLVADAAALGKRVGDFAKGGLHGFFVSRDGHLLRSPGIFEIARTAAEVEQRQRGAGRAGVRSEEHTSELQSLMRISYAVFCLKKKKKQEVY